MKESLYRPLKICFLVLKTCGVWQDGEQTWTYFIIGYFVHVILMQLYIVCLFMYAFQAEDLIDFAESFGLATTVLALFIKCLNFLINIKDIMKLVESVEILLKFSGSDEHRIILNARVQFGYKIMKIFLMTGIISCLTAIFPPFFSHQLPYKFWLPFDIKNSETGFWITSISSLLSSPFTAELALVLDVLPVIFLTFAIGLVEELCIRIEGIGRLTNLKGSKRSQFYKIELVKCIQIHQKIKKFVLDIQNSFSMVIMVQGVLSSAIICTCTFTMSKVRKFY